jgi:4-hydroxy-tetrahydrodipicolinate synthase
MGKALSAIVTCNTPFDDKGDIDEAAFRRQLRRLRDAGVAVYVVGPGTGEAPALLPEEQERLFAIAREELKGKVPVRAMGCEPRVPREMIEFLKRAERAKLDAAHVYSLDIGHAAKPTLSELETYYSTVIDSTSIPVYLSCHHAVGYVIPMDLIARLLDRFSNVVGIAYGGPDINYLNQLIRRFGDRMEIHCAGVYNGVTTLGLGGNGFMGVEGNLCPTLYTSVIADFQSGDRDALSRSFGKLIGLWALVARFGGSSGRGLKPLMNAFGLPGGSLRPPRIPISSAELEEMTAELLKLEIPDIPSPNRA